MFDSCPRYYKDELAEWLGGGLQILLDWFDSNTRLYWGAVWKSKELTLYNSRRHTTQRKITDKGSWPLLQAATC